MNVKCCVSFWVDRYKKAALGDFQDDCYSAYMYDWYANIH
ncbi:hypothetical protein DR96_3840 [Providencia stuartii]|nr:hypothetical protein DR96_3840 [Providencia stuartii]